MAAPLPALELATTAGHLIRRAQQVHTALWSQRMHGELTGPQYAVLVALAHEPGIDQTRLGELASLDRNTTADIVSRLDKQGWVYRIVNPADRRQRCLELTASARVALRYITPAAAEVQNDLLAAVPEVDRGTFVNLLAAVAFSGVLPPPAPPPSGVQVLAMARTPGYLIRRSQQVHTALWAHLVGPAVTGPQYAVLVALSRQPGLDQVTIGTLASLDRSSTADIVARLARGGWVERRVAADDARRSTVTLTRDGTQWLAGVTPKAQAVHRELLGLLRPDEASELTGLLARVAYQGAPPVRNGETPTHSNPSRSC